MVSLLWKYNRYHNDRITGLTNSLIMQYYSNKKTSFPGTSVEE